MSKLIRAKQIHKGVTYPEEWHLPGVGTLKNVHLARNCIGPHCPLHNPSKHRMATWPFDVVAGMIMRECPHGLVHPDPDNPPEALDAWMKEYHQHNCSCRCCFPPLDQGQI